jgi:hypothetical protein
MLTKPHRPRRTLNLAASNGRVVPILPRPAPARATLSALTPLHIQRLATDLQILAGRRPAFTRALLRQIAQLARSLQPTPGLTGDEVTRLR